MKKVFLFRETKLGNIALVETEAQHGIYQKLSSGRKRLTIVRTQDTQEELLARTRIVGGKNIEVIASTYCHYEEGHRFAMELHQKAIDAMKQKMLSLAEVKEASAPSPKAMSSTWSRTHQRAPA